jgi:hypothetical protein
MSSRTTDAVQQEPGDADDPASPAEKVEIMDDEPSAAQPDGAAATGDTAEADAADDAAGVPEPVASETAEDGEEAKDRGEAGVPQETDAPETIEPAETAETAEMAEMAEMVEMVETTEASEPTELIEMSEPVELAEPVELTEPARHGHGLLLALGFLAAAVVIIGAAVGIVGALTHGFRPPAPIVTYKTSPVFALRTGECVNSNGQRFSVVSCAVPHDAEVYATFRLPQSTWPGTAKVRTAASAGCQSRLSGYLNPQLALSLATTYVFPGQVAWQAGTRTVICEVRPTGGQLTGSVRAGANSAA